MDIFGRCHCGNVSLTIDWPDASPVIEARACGCTFCRKHGAAWTSKPGATLTVRIVEETAVLTYRFGTGTAVFYVCSRCGVPPLVTSELEGKLYAVVNVNVLEGIDPLRLRQATANFDDEDVATRLARRERNWIADVRFETAG